MQRKLIKYTFTVLLSAIALLGLTMCGGEQEEAAEEGLSAMEEEVLSEEYELEALETIDEANADAEADKLAAEIEADLK